MAGKLLGLTSDWGKERSVGEDWRLRDTPMFRPPRYSDDQLSLRLLSEQSDQMYSCLMLGTIWFWYTWLYWYRASCLMYWPTISSTSTIKTLQKLDSASPVRHVCYHFKFQIFVNGIKEYPNKVACHSFYRFKIQCTKILKTNSFLFFEYHVWALTMADFWQHWRLIFLFRDGGIELGGGAVVWWIVVRNRLQTLAVWMVLISSAVWGISHIIQSLHGFCYCSISTWKQNEKFLILFQKILSLHQEAVLKNIL